MKNQFKAFIRVVKSINSDSFYNNFGSQNIIREPLIMAADKAEVKTILLERYPQFFQNGKIYEKETKDTAQFFYVVIYELFNSEKELIEKGPWTCCQCSQEHENQYISKPSISYKLFPDKLFCKDDDDTCLNNYKKEYYKHIEFPDDEYHITKFSNNYIYKITEKLTGKAYVGKTRNEPFFRWWNHLRHSSSPFGLYLRQTKISDWTFEVLEVLPHDIQDSEVFKVESNYMVEFDTIKNGFNSVVSNKSVLPDIEVNPNQMILDLTNQLLPD